MEHGQTKKRITLNAQKIVKSRDKKQMCPNCWAYMRYKKVSAKMAEWSPCSYAWFCTDCPSIMLDGSIDLSEHTWDRQIRVDERRRINKYLSSVIRNFYKKKEE